MRRKEERSKQGQTNNNAKQHSTPKAVTFPKKNELPVPRTCAIAQKIILTCALANKTDTVACWLGSNSKLYPGMYIHVLSCKRSVYVGEYGSTQMLFVSLMFWPKIWAKTAEHSHFMVGLYIADICQTQRKSL